MLLSEFDCLQKERQDLWRGINVKAPNIHTWHLDDLLPCQVTLQTWVERLSAVKCEFLCQFAHTNEAEARNEPIHGRVVLIILWTRYGVGKTVRSWSSLSSDLIGNIPYIYAVCSHAQPCLFLNAKSFLQYGENCTIIASLKRKALWLQSAKWEAIFCVPVGVDRIAEWAQSKRLMLSG